MSRRGLLSIVVFASLGLSSSAQATHPERVYVGVYLSDVSGFDINEGRFKADLQLWVKWLGDETPPPVRIANGEVESMTEVARENDGDWRSVRWRVQGTFRGTFPLHDFPFDRQTLKLQLELPKSEGELVPELSGSGMSKAFSITGWLYEPYFSTQTAPSQYASDFGSINNEGQPLQVDSVTFSVELSRPFAAYVVKFVVPLAVVIVMAVLSLMIDPEMIDIRGTIGVTALLSCVALQFTMSDAMPDVSYLVKADKLLIGSYIASLVTLVLAVVNYRIYEEHSTAATWMDRAGYVAIPLICLIGAIVLIRTSEKPSAHAEVAPAHYGLPPSNTSIRNELVVSMVGLKSLNRSSINPGLVRRGLYYVAGGKKVPHLAVAVPKLTNEYVRFLPDGGMTVRWQLRPGMLWSDGQKITAEDVAFSAGIYPNEGRKNVEVIDAHNVEITFADRRRAYLGAFDVFPKSAVAPVLEKDGLDGLNKMIAMRPPPGDGPYKLATFEAKKEITFVRNRYFAGPTPAIEKLKLAQDPRAVAEKIKAGDSDLAWLVGPGSIAALQEWGGATVRSDKMSKVYFLQPDLTVPPFDKIEVRQALLHAIDRKRASATMFAEDGRIAHSYVDADKPEYAKDVATYAFDPALSKKLLKQSGLRLPVAINLVSNRFPKGAPEDELLKLIRGDLENAGFAVKMDWIKGSRLKRWASTKHGGLFYYARSSGFAPRFWNVPYGKGKFRIDEPNRLWTREVMELEQRRSASLFVERRIDLTRRMQRIFAKTLPVLPLFYGVNRSVHPKTLVGWDPYGGGNVWWNVEHWHFTAPKDPVAD